MPLLLLYVSARTTSPTQHSRQLGFRHCWPVRLEQFPGPCLQPERMHRICFQAPANDICSHVTSALSALGPPTMGHTNQRIDIDCTRL